MPGDSSLWRFVWVAGWLHSHVVGEGQEHLIQPLMADIGRKEDRHRIQESWKRTKVRMLCGRTAMLDKVFSSVFDGLRVVRKPCKGCAARKQVAKVAAILME